VPAHQFDFQEELSREYALFSLFKVLVDVEGSVNLLVLCALDLTRAFDSHIFAQILVEALKREVEFSVIKCLRYTYKHLLTKMKCGSELFNVLKGVRQGGLTSPTLFSNSILPVKFLLNPPVLMAV